MQEQEGKPLSEKRIERAKFEVTYCGLGERGLEEVRRFIGVVEENMVLLRLREDVVKVLEDVIAAEKFLECVSHSEYQTPLTVLAKEMNIDESHVRRFIRSFKELPLQELVGSDVCLLSTRDSPSPRQRETSRK